MPVVAPGELQNSVAPREAARKPDGAHRGLRPRGDEPHQLERRNRVDELLGELDLALGRGAEGGAVADRVDDRPHGLGVGVAEDQRPPRHHPVDVAAALLVLDVRALAPTHEERLVEPDGPHRPDRRVDAARDNVARAPP